MARPIRVLSIDGGGVRGYIPALVLAELERVGRRPIGALFDLIVGTSTGAIIGIGLAAGKSAAELAEFYPRYGRRIFGGTDDRSELVKRLLGPGQNLRESMEMSARAVGGPFGGNPRFDGNVRHRAHGLEGVLVEVLGEQRLSTVTVPLAVTTFDRLTAMPVVLSSRDARTDPTFDLTLADAARATSAAPTYFPPLQVRWAGADREFVDGGVWANNPSGVAAIESLALSSAAALTGQSVVMLSLGTGVAQREALFDNTGSWLGTGRDLAGLATSVWAGELLAERAFRGGYHRLQVVDDRIAGAMNDPSTQRLEALASAATALVERESVRISTILAALG